MFKFQCFLRKVHNTPHKPTQIFSRSYVRNSTCKRKLPVPFSVPSSQLAPKREEQLPHMRFLKRENGNKWKPPGNWGSGERGAQRIFRRVELGVLFPTYIFITRLKSYLIFPYLWHQEAKHPGTVRVTFAPFLRSSSCGRVTTEEGWERGAARENLQSGCLWIHSAAPPCSTFLPFK